MKPPIPETLEAAACRLSNPVMENITPPEDIIDAAGGFWQQLDLLVRNMLSPSRLAQVAAVILLMLAAHLLARLLSPMLRRWLRKREGWPKWQLRIGLIVDRRLRLILFTLMAWAAVGVLTQLSLPALGYVVTIAAELATAVLLIAFLSRLIANPLARRIAKWAAWIWAVLYLLNLTPSAGRLMDSIALSLGSFRISLLTVVQAAAVMTALLAGARVLTGVLTRRLATSADLSPTMRVLTAKILQIGLFTLAIVIGLKAIGVDLTGLAVFSGAVGVGLGFGLQKVVSNLVSGVIILLDKSVKPGDVISLGDTFGWIDALGARYVSVVTRDGKEYLIPNEDLVTNQVVNWSHTNNFVRLDVHFGTAYGDDPHEVSRVAINAAMTVKRVLAQRTPVCWITGFGDSSVDYVLRFWISDAQGGLTNVRGQVFIALWDAFKEQDIHSFPRVRSGLGEETGRPAEIIAGDWNMPGSAMGWPRRGDQARRPEDLPLSNHVQSADQPNVTAAPQDLSSDEILQRILTSLDDDKAEDVVTIDLRGRSAMADHMVIASGRNARQVATIAEKLAQRIKDATGRSARIEGKDAGDWVLIDTDDVVVHVFRPEVREFYQLEKMWMPSDQLKTLRAEMAAH